MAKPIICKVTPFDATKPYTFEIAWSGNRSYKNRLVILDNTTNQSVYDVTETTFSLQHTIPSNTLENGIKYIVQAQVYDVNNEPSSMSDKVLFYTLSTPSFYFINLPKNNIITNSSFNARVYYYSSDLEELQGYQFYLYDTTGKQLLQSDIMSDQDDMFYSYKGLENNTHYFIRCIATTINGLELDTGMVEISVKFESPTEYSQIYTTPNNNRGCINISTNIIVIQDGNDKEYNFEDGMIDLRNDSIFYNEGFVIDGDFTMIIRGKELWKEGTIFIGKNTDSNYEFTISSRFYNGGDVLRFKLTAKNGISKYIIYSNPVFFEDSDMITLGVRRINNIYAFRLFADTGFTTENNYWYGLIRPTISVENYDIWFDTDNSPTYMVDKDDMSTYLTTIEPENPKVEDLWVNGE